MYRVDDGRQSPARGVAGHLQHGQSHVAADAERDAEPDAAEDGQLEPGGAARARVAAVRTAVVAQLVQRSLAAASAAARLLRYLVQLTVVIRNARLRPRSKYAAVHALAVFMIRILDWTLKTTRVGRAAVTR